jgi:hypothetical protein
MIPLPTLAPSVILSVTEEAYTEYCLQLKQALESLLLHFRTQLLLQLLMRMKSELKIRMHKGMRRTGTPIVTMSKRIRMRIAMKMNDYE